MQYGNLKGELEKKVGLSIGFEGLRDKLDKLGDDRKSMVIWKDLDQRGVGRNLPEISE